MTPSSGSQITERIHERLRERHTSGRRYGECNGIAEKATSTRFLLIVGENEATWKVLQKAIKQEARYLTLVAKTSEEAIHFARNIQPLLVLIPYHLPGLNGMELYRRLKTIAPEKVLPAIMIMKEGEKMRHEHLPELHLLEEPYSLDMLLQLLKHLSMG